MTLTQFFVLPFIELSVKYLETFISLYDDAINTINFSKVIDLIWNRGPSETIECLIEELFITYNYNSEVR